MQHELSGQSDQTREHNARYAECETMDDCWREYLGDDYSNEEIMQDIGAAASAKRYGNRW